jgi:dynein heavy chain, axonemal
MPSVMNNNEIDSPVFTGDVNIMAGKQPQKESKNTGLSASALFTIESSFIFSTVWTFGSIMSNNKDKEGFDEFLRERIGIEDLSEDIPSISSIRKNIVQTTATSLNYFNISPDIVQRPNFALPLKRKIKVFDMLYDKERKDWIKFDDLVPPSTSDNSPEKDSPELMIVPTHDITKAFYLIELYSDAKKSLLITGPTGTGKSVLLKQYMAKQLKSNEAITMMINFTATITSESFQKRVESKLERHRKGILAPVLGRHLIVIAEDVHMASQDVQGVHPSLELLRQWFDYSGWFDMKFSDFRKLENLFYIAAMTPRLGNEKSMSYRILRHFALITMGQPSDMTFHEIFETIYSEISKKFSERATRGIEDRIVTATLELYRKVEEEFKPTPNRIHYTFNIRDVGNVFKGMSLCNPKTIRKKDNLIRLWYHEGLRIFYDRLVDDMDRIKFLRIIDGVTTENFKSVSIM